MAKAAKSKIIDKLKKKGLDKAHKTHKADETVIQGSLNLPAGIENGIAELIEAGLFEHTDKDKGPTGEAYARLSGIVKQPKKFDGFKCEGKRVSVFIPLYDTPNSQKKPKFEDHYADLLNELRKFGIDTEELDPDDLEETLAELVEEGPHFRFRTWGGEPYIDPKTKKERTGRVNEVFLGIEEDYEEEEDPDAGVTEEEDEEVEVEEEEDEEEEPKAKAKSKASPKKSAKKPPVEEEEEEEDEDEETGVSVGDTGTAPYDGEDFSVVVDKIEGDTLTVHNAEDKQDVWDVDVSEFVPDEGEAEEEEEEEEEAEEAEEAAPPEEGEMRMYDGVEVIVDKVYPRKKTADVTDADNDDVYEGVSWDELTEVE